MVKLCSIAVVLCLLASNASAQESKSANKPAEHTVILDISMIEVNLNRTEDLERAAKEKGLLNTLIAEGKARPIASLQMRARSGEQSIAHIGQRVPIQTGTLPLFNQPNERQRRIANQQPNADPNGITNSDAFGVVGVPQIQYESTGLKVTATPSLVGEQIEVRLVFEMTGLQTSTGALTPTFIQRTVSDVVRVREGETALLLGMVQNESLWSSFAQHPNAQPSDQSHGSFIVLLSARLVD